MSRIKLQAVKGIKIKSPTQRFVAWVLADAHNSETGQCNPSIAYLMEVTGFSNRPICKAISDLEKAGYVSIRRGYGAKNYYTLNFETSDPKSLSNVTLGHGLDGGTSDSGSHSNMTLKTQTSDSGAKSSDPRSHDREIGKDKELKGRAKNDRQPTFPDMELEPPFHSVLFRETWQQWIDHRKEIKKPLTENAKRLQFADFLKWGEVATIENIQTAIKNGYQGIFHPKSNQSNQKPQGQIYTGKTL